MANSGPAINWSFDAVCLCCPSGDGTAHNPAEWSLMMVFDHILDRLRDSVSDLAWRSQTGHEPKGRAIMSYTEANEIHTMLARHANEIERELSILRAEVVLVRLQNDREQRT